MVSGDRKRKRQGMERFPDDGRRVRLRSRGRDGLYLQASEDGVGVHLSPSLAESLRAEWQVHRVERDGETFLLLCSSAYGRYLATAPRGYLGQRIVQGVYDDEYLDAVAWSPRTVAQEDDDVQLWHGSSKLCLTANGKYFRWRTSVSLGKYGARNVMMHWVVEAIPAMLFMPQLPPPSPAAPPGGFWNKILGRNTPVVERRMIRFVRATDDGGIDPEDWRIIEFQGRSVYNLRSVVAENLNDDVGGIKLRVRAGMLGHLVTLLTDLPKNDESIDIVVFSTGAPDLDVIFNLLPNEDLPGIAADVGVVFDLPQDQDPIHSDTSSDRVLSLQKSRTEEEPGKTTEEWNDITAGAAGQALGEHPDIGINTAEQRMLDAESELNNARKDLNTMMEKLRTLQEVPREQRTGVHQGQVTKLKKDIDKKKIEYSRLEEEAGEASVVYQREDIRAQNS